MSEDKTFGARMRGDARIAQAKALLSEVLAEHQKSLTAVRPPNPALAENYDRLLKRMADLRGRGLFYPYLSSGLGNGALVELADGSVKYDFITGIGVHYMGHSHPKLLESSVDAALEDTLMQGNLQQDAASLELMEDFLRAARRTGGPLKHCFLSSSGAMANENALKIIFQNKSPASRWLAFEHCFAGRTLATAQITDKPANREGLPWVLDVDYVPFFDAAEPEVSTRKAVTALKTYLDLYPGQYAGMSFELIQGEGGYYAGDSAFFKTLMDLLKEAGVAVMIDEIQTFGRTPELFAFQYFGLEAYVDVVTIGKMAQVCATFFTADMNPKPGLLSQTFTASSAQILGARMMLAEILNGGYLGANGKIAERSGQFRAALETLAKKYPDRLRGPFGLGAMTAFTVFDGTPEKTKRFLENLYQAGVMAFAAGQNPSRVRMLMPVAAVTEHCIRAVAAMIEKTLSETAEGFAS